MGLIIKHAISTNSIWLPWLIKGLKVKDVVAPSEHSTNTLLPKGLSVCYTSLSSSIDVLGVCWPSCLSSPELDMTTTGNILNMLKGLRNIIKINMRSIRNRTRLPEAKSISEDDIGAALDDSITSAIGPLVPAVCGADLDAAAQRGLDVGDFRGQSGPR
jgi:hypothetical protein